MTPWSWVRGRAAGWRRGRWRGSGRSVLLVERGDYPDTDHLARDHLRNARTDSGLDHRTLRSSAQNPRTVLLDRGPGRPAGLGPALRQQRRHVRRRNPGVRRAGLAVRARGLRDGDNLRSTGRQRAGRLADRLRRPGAVLHPGRVRDRRLRLRRTPRRVEPAFTPLPDGADGHHRARPPVARGCADSSGWSTVPVPLAINSAPRDGRAACARCRQCVGFACPVEAKNGSENTVLARAAATGNLSILLATRAERILTDPAGRVTGVDLVADHRRLPLASRGERRGRGRRGRGQSSRPGSC